MDISQPTESKKVLYRSEQINELAKALAKAQGKITGAERNKLNPHLRNRYSDLASVWDAIREPLSANGLAIIQTIRATKSGVLCATMMMHGESGQWVLNELEVPCTKMDAQGIGSAATYARRYSLMCMTGVAPADIDADGNAAVGTAPEQKPEVPLDPQIVESFTNARDMAALSQAWNAIPVGIRKLYTGVKDEAKARLGGAA